jgi:RNA polymerase sigma-70 factor (ECF subfamily)
LEEQEKQTHFERTIMPHTDAAYNLARWLSGNEHDAQDVLQEAYIRAFRFLDGLRGSDARAWLLRIVRNVFYDWLQKNRPKQAAAAFDEKLLESEPDPSTPATILALKNDAQLVRKAIEDLPVEFREVMVMRELESLSYKEIAVIADVPVGTVMSRLARAREQLRVALHSRGGDIK